MSANVMRTLESGVTQPERGRREMGRQPKLTIGKPGDKYEQEADRVARKVVQQINSPQNGTIEGEEKGTPQQEIQRKALTGGTRAPINLEGGIKEARGRGKPLEERIRKPMEKAMGVDFSGVRVHTDARADQLNQSIQAKAFTTGQDVFFRQGAYEPGSRRGQELIAHEMTHVVQQNGGAVQRRPIQPQQLHHRPACETPSASVCDSANKPNAENTGTRIETTEEPQNPTGTRYHLKTGIENLTGHGWDEKTCPYNFDKPGAVKAQAFTQGKVFNVAPVREIKLPLGTGHVVEQKHGRVKADQKPIDQIMMSVEHGREYESPVLGIQATHRAITCAETRTKGIPQLPTTQTEFTHQYFGLPHDKSTVKSKQIQRTKDDQPKPQPKGTVQQGKFIIWHKNDAIPGMTTIGAGPCIVISLTWKEEGICGLAHLDSDCDVDATIEYMLLSAYERAYIVAYRENNSTPGYVKFISKCEAKLAAGQGQEGTGLIGMRGSRESEKILQEGQILHQKAREYLNLVGVSSIEKLTNKGRKVATDFLTMDTKPYDLKPMMKLESRLKFDPLTICSDQPVEEISKIEDIDQLNSLLQAVIYSYINQKEQVQLPHTNKVQTICLYNLAYIIAHRVKQLQHPALESRLMDVVTKEYINFWIRSLGEK
ncbi:MAG: DUF4157 domain-containing protein [Moorea sp. SIO4A3]|nr:DUF4157 domain-containing protein [Moorena sp. SIO4A3]